MKKIFGCLAIVGCLLLGACNGGESTSKSDVIKVGTEAAFPPFEYLSNGEITGFDVDLLEAVMKEAGLKYELDNIGFDPIFASLNTDEIQLGVSGISITEKRLKSHDFTNPYYESTHLILVDENSTIANAEDLKKLDSIGVQMSTTGAIATEKIVGEKSKKIKSYDTTALAIMALKNGDVQAVVTDNTVADEYLKNNPNDKFKTIADPEVFESEFYGFVVKKGNDDLLEKLDKALYKVMENGKYTEIYKKWFGKEPNLDALDSEK